MVGYAVASRGKPFGSTPKAASVLQPNCACGNHAAQGEQRSECARRSLQRKVDQNSQAAPRPLIQRKLTLGASDDPLEEEADRLSNQVLTAATNPAVGGAPLLIQRSATQATGPEDTAPTSAERVLASPGMPLNGGLQQDMEQRFGHDFSRVRVHCDSAAEHSARDLNASAYTFGHHIVFGANRFAPDTFEGRRLIAHELVHVVQQSGAGGSVGRRNDISRNQNAMAEPDADRRPKDALTAASPAPISRTGLAIARKPRADAPAAPGEPVRMMTREEARAVLADYMARGGYDETLAALAAIQETLRMSSTAENWRMRLRVLAAAFSLLDADAASRMRKILTRPEGAEQEHLRRRFERVDSYFQTRLLAILRERASAKPAREEEQAPKPAEQPSLKGKAPWIELGEGVFAYVASAGMTLDQVAAYISGHPVMPNLLAKLNGVARTTRLPEARPVIVPIEFIDRERAIQEMPEDIRNRIASMRQGQALQAQYGRFVKVKSGHPLGGPGAVGLIPVTMATGEAASAALEAAIAALAEPVKYLAGFIVGLLEGAWDAVVEVFEGALDIIKTVGTVLRHVVTGNFREIWKMLKGWIQKLELAWKNRGQIAADFMEKWEAKDLWDRGRFQGKVLGWVMMTVLITILTLGAGAVVQIAGKWKFVIDALKLADRAGDLGTYARAVGKLPDKAADLARRKLGRKTGEAPEEPARQVEQELAKRPEREAMEKAPEMGALTQIQQSVTLAGKGHTLSIKRVGNQLKLWLCSNGCGELVERCERLFKSVSDDAARAELDAVKKRAQLLDRRLNSGKVTLEEAEKELARLGNRLERLAAKESSAVAEVLEGGAAKAARLKPSEIDPPGTQYKKPVPGQTGKEAATDIPKWVRDEGYPPPRVGEKGEDYATRILNHKYGEGKWPRGPGKEHNKVQKWADRHFE